MAEIEFNRPFQELDVPWFLEHPKSLILYEPRLGKTPVTCRVLALDPLTKVVLVCCSKNALLTWLDHLIPWWNHYRGKDKPLYIRLVRGKNSKAKQTRMELWNRPIPADAACMVYLTTFEAFAQDEEELEKTLMRRVDTIILDEAQRKLRNRNTKSHSIYKKYARQKNIHRMHILSGTMAGKWGPADFFGCLSILAPQRFTSYWGFVETFCLMVEGAFGKEIIGVRNRELFHEIMSQYSRIRLRSVEAPNMPKVVRSLIPVEPTAEQMKVFNDLGGKSYHFLDSGDVLVAENSLEKHMRKRQLMACPRILSPTLGIGAAFEDLVDKLEEAREDGDVDGTNVVIFTSFRAAIPHFEKHLREHGFNDIGILVGGTEPEDVRRITEQHRQRRGIILCTTAFAQAFSLVPSKVCYHIGWDYAPDNNKQAEDRLVPQTGDFSINSFYYSCKGTDDDELGPRITLKSQIIHATITRPGQDELPNSVHATTDTGGDIL